MAVAHEPGTGHDAGGEEQGIPRQEGRDHEAGLAKDDDEQDGIDPHPVLFHQFEEMGVDMQDEVHQICQKFHVHLNRDLRLKAFPLYPSHACGTTPTAALLPLRGRLHPFSCLARSHACPFRRHHGPALPFHHRPGPGR